MTTETKTEHEHRQLGVTCCICGIDMTTATTVEPSAEIEPAKLFTVDFENDLLVPSEGQNGVVFETRTGKVWAYLENDELIVTSYEGPVGVIVMPDSEQSVKVIAAR